MTMLVGMAGAFIARINPGLALDAGEAAMIAQAAQNVAVHYDVPVSPVAQAWIGLAGTVGMIYSAKIAAIRISRAAPVETVQ